MGEVSKDEHPRPALTLEKVSRPPARVPCQRHGDGRQFLRHKRRGSGPGRIAQKNAPGT